MRRDFLRDLNPRIDDEQLIRLQHRLLYQTELKKSLYCAQLHSTPSFAF